MRAPIKLPRLRWYWYLILALGALLSALTISPLSSEAQTAAHVYHEEGLSELTYRTKDNLHLLSKQPNIEWESAAPEDVGLDPEKLSGLGDQMAQLDTHAFLVVKGGKIVYEYYPTNFGPNHRLRLSAAGKAIAASLALAVAMDDGLVDVDSPAWHYIPSWKDDPVRSKITVRHLAAHSSGIENVGWSSPGLEGWMDEFDRDLSERFPLTLDTAPVLFEPGSRFEYSSTGYYALSYVLTDSLKNAPESDLQTLLQNRIMGPMGIAEDDWRLDFEGPHKLNGLDLYYAGEGRYPARAIARIGQLMLNRGAWNGERLIRPETIDALVSYPNSPVIRPVDENDPTWGLGWRLNDDGFFPSLPRDSFLALRETDKIMLVVPSLDLVMLRFGSSLAGQDTAQANWNDVDRLLFRPLMEAVVQ